jgi:hypothetical protein
MYLPNTHGALAWRYVDSRKPDFIVISDFSYHRTYLKDWIQDGIPVRMPTWGTRQGLL